MGEESSADSTIDRQVTNESDDLAEVADRQALRESGDLTEALEDRARLHQLKFAEFGRVEDIDTAIHLWEKSLLKFPSGDSGALGVLNNLAVSLQYRFEHFGKLQDNERAIEVLGQSVSLTPDGHPNKPAYLSNLGNSFKRRFERLGELHDVERAIESLGQSVALAPDGDPNKPAYLCNLGGSLQRRFERIGELQDIERAVDVLEQSVSLTPDGHPIKPSCLVNLGVLLNRRFERLGELPDIERAIEVLRQSVLLTPDGNPKKPMHLDNLGGSFHLRFERLGELQDIEKAVESRAQSIFLTPDGHPNKPLLLSNLGTSLWHRFERLGELKDIEWAIEVLKQSVSLTPDGHPDKPMYLGNLGVSLWYRFEQLREPLDIERAIEVLGQSASLTSDSHPDKPIYLGNLGISLLRRFNMLQELQDIKRAIEALGQSVYLTPNGHPNKPKYLANLGGSLNCHFERVGELQNIKRAIEVLGQSVSLTPDGHPDKPGHLCELGISYIMCFMRLKDTTDIDKAINSFSKAATSTAGRSSVRFLAARRWINTLQLKHQCSVTEKLRAYGVLVKLVPELVWLGLPVSKRYQIIMQELGPSINDAAAAAIEAGEFQLAIEWMEQGRSIIWGQLMNLRSPLDDLRASHAILAGNLELLSGQLKMGSFQGISSDKMQIDYGHPRPSSLEEQARNYRRIVQEREQLLEQIRNLPGFESFLLPKGFSQLSEAARSNPVVMINISELRCDALALFHPSSPPIHIYLPEFSYEKAKALHSLLLRSLRSYSIHARNCNRGWPSGKDNDFQTVLAGLWTLVVHPIVQGVKNLLSHNAKDCLPHITWCPTGHLSFLPLHAAGIYGSNATRMSVLDLIVSSYVPTLTVMIDLQAKHSPRLFGLPRMLLVTQPNTKGHEVLPGTLREAEIIEKEMFGEHDECYHLTREQATPSAVLDALDKYDWVHFACHGTQDFEDPTNSAFILHDGKLRLRSIMDKAVGNAYLAFLSACETATGDEKLPEEAVHLASGMLAAGYSQVISTMWSIRDDDAPRVVESFYQDLLAQQAVSKIESSGSYAAYALHRAVKRLREEVGETDFERWVPFVHFGI